MKYQYFISSRWRNRDIVLELTQKLRTKGKVVYCFLEGKENFASIEDDPETAMKEYESTDDWWNNEKLKRIFQADMDALKSSEALVLLLPAGKSSHIEVGTAYGLGKKCILVGDQKEAESLYLLFAEHYDSIDEFISAF